MNLVPESSGYAFGFRNGRLDRWLAIELRIARFSEIPGYSAGYIRGVLGLPGYCRVFTHVRGRV